MLRSYRPEIDFIKARTQLIYNKDKPVELCSERGHEHEPRSQVLETPDLKAIDQSRILCRHCAQKLAESDDRFERSNIETYVGVHNEFLQKKGKKLGEYRAYLVKEIREMEEAQKKIQLQYIQNQGELKLAEKQSNEFAKNFLQGSKAKCQLDNYQNRQVIQMRETALTEILAVVAKNREEAQAHLQIASCKNGEQALVRRQEAEYSRQTTILQELQDSVIQDLKPINSKLQRIVVDPPKIIEKLRNCVTMDSKTTKFSK